MWGLGDEKEEWNIRTTEELLDEMNEMRLDDLNKPKLTYWGTLLLAFIKTKYGGEFDENYERIFSLDFVEELNDSYMKEFGAYFFAMNRIDQNMSLDQIKKKKDITFRTIEHVLSERGVEEFKNWSEGSSFASDMQKYGTFLREQVIDGQDAGLEWLVRLGFV